jgi:hypothetical protein
MYNYPVIEMVTHFLTIGDTMEYSEAVQVVKKVGNDDLLAGMEHIKMMIDLVNDETSSLIFKPVPRKYLQAYNIVWKGMNKLFNG